MYPLPDDLRTTQRVIRRGPFHWVIQLVDHTGETYHESRHWFQTTAHHIAQYTQQTSPDLFKPYHKNQT